MENSSLLDPQTISAQQKLAEKKYTQYTTDEWRHLRRLAKTDLFFLAQAILRFNKLSKNLHGHMASWMKANENEKFREILIPRGHYKSTLATITDSIQIVIPDDVGDCSWPRNLGPNCRLLIGHEVHDMAGRFLGAIQGHFLGNPLLMGLFPEVVPSPKKHRITKHELELVRSEIWAEPTIDTIGVGGKTQGRHYNFIKLDDLFGDKARDSQAEREATIGWFDNIQSFFSTFARDKFDLIGTRWAFDDIYAHAHERYGDKMKKYIRSCLEINPESGLLEPIFPEEFPIETLEIIKQNRKIWNAQYVNDPSEGSTKFDPSWKRYYEWVGHNRVQTPDGRICNTRDMDIVVLIDPAPEGLGGYLVTGTDQFNRVFTLEAERKAYRPPELIEKIFASAVRWQPRLVVIESVNFSEIYQYWLMAEMGRRGIRFRVEPAKTRNRSKELRIDGLQNYYAAGHIYYHKLQKDLIEEHDTYGASNQIHILDALAYGPEFWRPGLSRAVWDNYAKVAENLAAERDAQTGYSVY